MKNTSYIRACHQWAANGGVLRFRFSNTFKAKMVRSFCIAVLFLGSHVVSWRAFASGSSETPCHVAAFWGTFDPPTAAHLGIINAALSCPQLAQIEELYVIINDNGDGGKKYMFPAKQRQKALSEMINEAMMKDLKGTLPQQTKQPRVTVKIQTQDDSWDYSRLKKEVNKNEAHKRLCVIAGYDSYKKWINFSTQQQREQYDAIAIVPRGSEKATIFDKNAFILSIAEDLRHVSSTQIREALKKEGEIKSLETNFLLLLCKTR